VLFRSGLSEDDRAAILANHAAKKLSDAS
jgi:hypothetical protein